MSDVLHLLGGAFFSLVLSAVLVGGAPFTRNGRHGALTFLGFTLLGFVVWLVVHLPLNLWRG